jgi:hypothetical protein
MAKSNRNAALVLAFNRTDSTERLIRDLINFGVNKIYVSIDGPRNAKDLDSQKLILDFLAKQNRDLDVCIKIKKNETNLGLAIAILTALKWFFSNETCGYIIEDDLDFDSNFLDFCDGALLHFEQKSDVWLISGNQYSNDKNSGIWVNYPLIWGWASWREKWNEIEKCILDNHLNTHSSLPLNVTKFWQLGNWRAQKGILDSWAVPLAANMRLRNKYCLLPPVNLVSNRGVGEGAVHTTENAWHTNWKISNDLELTDFRSQWLKPKNNLIIEDSNHYLEENIYRIKPRHIFSTYISIFLDQIKRRSKRSSLFDELSKKANVQYF